MKSAMNLKIGSVIKEQLRLKNMSVRELSKLSGVPASTLGEWMNNRPPKSPTQIKKVAKYLGISLHYLLFSEEDSEEPLQKILKEDIFQGTYEITVRKVKL